MTKFKSEITFPQARFLEWALEQPKVRRIDHDGWSTCAVGDYHRETDDGIMIGKNNDYLCPAGFTSWSEYTEHILPRRLNGILTNNGRIPNSVRGLGTYGALQAYIRRHYVENDDESPSD